MTKSASRSRARRLLPLVIVVPLLLIPVAAYLVSADNGTAIRVAPGAASGFHPIAGEFVADATGLAGCGPDAGCLEQAFGNLAFERGPRVALAVFTARLRPGSVVERHCHRVVHFIGAGALERFGGNIARTFAHGSPVCVSGYYHGILERSFLGISTKAGLIRKARSLCVANGIRRRGFLDYQCRHGLGHGLMIQTGYDLPLALDVCAGLGLGWDHKACAGGAFMENINTRFGYRSPWLDDEDPLYPCGAVTPRDRRSCYLRASWRILTVEGGDWEKTAAHCATLTRWSATCFQGYGRDAAEDARYKIERILALCRAATVGEGECLRGAARTIANASGEAGIEPARMLCLRAYVAHRAKCFAGVGLVLGLLHATPASRRAACQRTAGELAGQCVKAAEAEVRASGSTSWG